MKKSIKLSKILSGLLCFIIGLAFLFWTVYNNGILSLVPKSIMQFFYYLRFLMYLILGCALIVTSDTKSRPIVLLAVLCVSECIFGISNIVRIASNSYSSLDAIFNIIVNPFYLFFVSTILLLLLCVKKFPTKYIWFLPGLYALVVTIFGYSKLHSVVVIKSALFRPNGLVFCVLFIICYFALGFFLRQTHVSLPRLKKEKVKEKRNMISADELTKYHKLLQEGVLTQEEFNELKKKAFGE